MPNPSTAAFPASCLHVSKIPDGRFQACAEAVRQTLERVRRVDRPTLVVVTGKNDPHPDHAAVGCEARRVFGAGETLLEYEAPVGLGGSFEPNLAVGFDEAEMELKLRFLALFASQGGKPFVQADNVRAGHRARALQMDRRQASPYCEPFRLIRHLVPGAGLWPAPGRALICSPHSDDWPLNGFVLARRLRRARYAISFLLMAYHGADDSEREAEFARAVDQFAATP